MRPGISAQAIKVWAWCLAISCTKDQPNAQQATCNCINPPATNPPTSPFPYVVVMKTQSYDASLCIKPPAPISSATIYDAFGIQMFLSNSQPVVTNPMYKK